MSKTTIAVGTLWLVCGVFTAGITVGYFQARYSRFAQEGYREDLAFGCLLGLLGPLGLFMVFFFSGFCEHGLQWKRKKVTGGQ